MGPSGKTSSWCFFSFINSLYFAIYICGYVPFLCCFHQVFVVLCMFPAQCCDAHLSAILIRFHPHSLLSKIISKPKTRFHCFTTPGASSSTCSVWMKFKTKQKLRKSQWLCHSDVTWREIRSKTCLWFLDLQSSIIVLSCLQLSNAFILGLWGSILQCGNF